MKIGKFTKLKIVILLILFIPLPGNSQSIDHWEAIVLAENDWQYRMGDSEPPLTWFQLNFDDNSWLTGPGGIGYGDGDDSTIIDPTYSLYLRREFNIIDTSLISALSFYADYDDAFVAYLNGVEICRANIGVLGVAPAYNDTVYAYREALLYQGERPEVFSIDKTLLNNGNNVLAVQVHNSSINSTDLSSIIFLLAGIEDESRHYQLTPSWFIEDFTSSNLPIFVIDTDSQTIVDEPKILASLGVIDNGKGKINHLTDSCNGYNGIIGIEIRGCSSQCFDKKSYGFETRLADGENNNVSLLGLPEENDWIHYGPYSDKSLMRNVLSMYIGRQTGEYASRTKWCELVIDGEYMGLYVLMEKIKRDKNRVDVCNLKEKDTTGVDLTGAYIFSVDRDEGPLSGWLSPHYYKPFYRYRDPNDNEIAPQQKSYIQNYICSFEEAVKNSSSSEEYSQYIDIPSFVNYWIATEIFKNLDNYKFSFFMYKTRDDKGGKIHFGPLWDLNLAYGNYCVDNPGPEGWSYIWAFLDFSTSPWIIDVSEDEDIQNRINSRWFELRQDKLSTDTLLNFIDTQSALIKDAQIRNFKRWPILGTYVWPNVFIGDTYEEEINYLKTWLSARLKWLDDNMVGTGSSTGGDPSAMQTTEYKLYQNYPNPFNPNTNISYDISTSADVSITIYDLSGNKVASIFDGYQEAGTYTLNFSSDLLTSGVYFYRLNADNWVDTKKMLFLK